MTLFPENAIYIVGNAKTQQSTPITHHFGQFFIAFVWTGRVQKFWPVAYPPPSA